MDRLKRKGQPPMEMEKATVPDSGGRTHPRGTCRNLDYEFGEDRATADQARPPRRMLELRRWRSTSGGGTLGKAHCPTFWL